MRHLHFAALLLSLAALATPASAQLTATPAVPPPARGARSGRSGPLIPAQPMPVTVEQIGEVPAPVPMDTFTKDLLDRLNSTDAARRDAAQKQLANIANVWQQPEILNKMLEQTTNPELKAAIQDRLDDIKSKQMQVDIQHLPNISLSVNGANLPELSTAFNAALHSSNPFLTTGIPTGNGSFTLDAKEKPFWEIWIALTQQQPLNISSSPTGLRLMNGGSAIRRYAIDGPAMAYVNNINYQRNTNLQTQNGDPVSGSSMSAQVVVGVDPRIRVARMQFLTTTAVDDNGRNLTPRTGGSSFSGTNTLFFNNTIQFQPDENFGKAMNMTIEARMSAVASEKIGTIKDLENNPNGSVTVAGKTISITRFQVNGNSISLQVNSNVNNPGGDAAMRASVILLDSTGKAVWSFQLAGGGVGTTVQAAGSTGPYRLEAHIPDKTIDIPLKFELKDVPLP